MKKFFVALLILGCPIVATAADFSKTFVGYINKVPVKLQLTNVNNQLRGNFAYKNNFENTYIPDSNYIFGSNKNGAITLNTNEGNTNNTYFKGKLLSSKMNGVTNYELNGIWQDKMRLMNQKVELKQLDLTADMGNPIVNQFKTTQSAANFYNTSASYPLFAGKNLTAHEVKINKTIESFVQTQVSAFEKSTTQSNKQENYKGLGIDANVFNLENMVTSSHPKLLSIRFMMFEMNYHAAHPNTNYASLNFNTQTGKQVTLAELFKPGSDYLNVISTIIRPELLKKLYPNLKTIDVKNPDVEWVYEGTKPDIKNYPVWNVYEGKLMITLPAYQVAAYVYGPQTIMIPFTKLKKIAKPGGIISEAIAS